ncbi:hypothetical protein C0995_006126, partial [Termitomyces sp. Mi166
ISLDLSMDINKTVHPEDGTLEVPGLHPVSLDRHDPGGHHSFIANEYSWGDCLAIDRDLETRGISLSLV